jgi:hypothetical protein
MMQWKFFFQKVSIKVCRNFLVKIVFAATFQTAHKKINPADLKNTFRFFAC